MIDIRNAIFPADCIVIHTDGSCIGNPGPGGWAASLVRLKGGVEVKKRIEKGRASATTNNRMELTAALEALAQLKLDEKAPIIVRSDSKYLIDGMTTWTAGWIAKGWRTSKGKAVENKDLWQALLSLTEGRQISWHWVRGHAGDRHNEEVNRIAQVEARAV